MNKEEIQWIKKYLSISESMVVKTQGQSMLPIIKSGDKIIINKIGDIKVGDIIVFFDVYDNNQAVQMIAHRVVEILNNDILVTKGDNNRFADNPIHRNDILGKVKTIISK